MAYIVMGPCINCGRLISFNPDLVPSIRARRTPGGLVEDPGAAREPVCRACIERANPERAKQGLPPIEILPGAYEPEAEPGDR